MKKISILFTTIFVLFLLSCTKDYEEINTDPNSMLTAPSTNIFAYTQYILASQYGASEISYPATYIGHASNYQYRDEVTYSTSGAASPWDYLFVNALNNLEFIIEEAQKDENPNMEAAAMILRAYAYHLLVDMYGPVPYFEANQGDEGLIFPKFDSEKEIYLDLLDQLKAANAMFDPQSIKTIGSEDLIYSGNIQKWKKFANSLRLRLAIRISNVSEVEQVAESNIAEIFNDPETYPVLSSNSDNPKVTFPGDANYREPWSRYSDISQYRIGKPLVDKLKEFNDPRLEHYAEPNLDGEYVGIEIGADSNVGISKIDPQFVDNDAGSVYFMKLCEIELIKAEAIVRGFISGSAQDAYQAGITASLSEYDIATDTINQYLTEDGVAWNNDLNQIYIQKWLSFIHQSWEAWAEMRRTDVPLLPLAINTNVSGHNRVPFRFNYPSKTKSNNGQNIPDYVNEDDFYWGYQIWWDTRTGVQ